MRREVLFDQADVETTIQRRFSRIVETYGHRPAVIESACETSYTLLEALSDCVSQAITERIGPEPEPVALMYRAGRDYFAAQLAVLKSRKFFASLDGEWDTTRLAAVIRHLGVRMILCDSHVEAVARTLAAAISGGIVLNTATMERASATPRVPEQGSPDDIAAVIYTSGSTGSPEGVVVTHRCLMHMAMLRTETSGLNQEDRILQICHLSSVASLSEILSAFMNGASLLPFDLRRSGAVRLGHFLRQERISICSFIPVVFRLLLSGLPDGGTLPDVRLVSLSGDRIVRRDFLEFRKHFSRACVLRTALGASETMVYTQYNMDHDYVPSREILPAGCPLSGMDVLIVDENRTELESGHVGEIVVKSNYLASGYWRNEPLTFERFSASGDDARCRLYFTGDIGYFDSDGCLNHVGRKDARVKIHGKFVLLTEIEEFILGLDGIDQAVVAATRDFLGDNSLVVFYAAAHENPASPLDIKRALNVRFPRELMPKKILRLESLPISERNKIDRRQLASNLEYYERLSTALAAAVSPNECVAGQ
jgi:non-ribosomal peptide synthetase component F